MMTSTNKFCKDLISHKGVNRYCSANKTHSVAIDYEFLRELDKSKHKHDYIFSLANTIIVGTLVVVRNASGYVDKSYLVASNSNHTTFKLELGYVFVTYMNEPVRIYSKIAYPDGMLCNRLNKCACKPALPRWEQMVAMRDAYTNYFAGWGLDFKHPCVSFILYTMIHDSVQLLREWLHSHENVAGTLLWYLPRDIRLLIADMIMHSIP